MDYLLRGILIGLLFGLPVGAVGAMTVWRTWNSGIKAGLFTGLGSSVADCFYAAVGAFGFTLISDFLLEYQIIINIFGGVFILFMGVRLLLKKNEIAFQHKSERTTEVWKMFFFLFCDWDYKPHSNSYIPVCFFLFWDFCKVPDASGNHACKWCIYWHLYLVGNTYGRYE